MSPLGTAQRDAPTPKRRFVRAGLFRYNSKLLPRNQKDRLGLTTSLRKARLGLVFVAAVWVGSCAETPTPTTPTPVVEPPVITCPASQTLTSAQATPIQVVYSSPSVTGGASPITTSCTPASGSTFPLGSTTVTCTALDARQRSTSCTMTVAVSAPPRVRLTKYVAFGDSITAGQDGLNSVTALTDGALSFLRSVILFGREYPTVLRAALQARYTLQSDIAVSNFGCPGEFVSENVTAVCGRPAVQRFTSAIQGQQVALLMEGSNDVNFGVKDSLAISGALGNLQRMVQSAKAAGVAVYLATIPPMNPTPACIPQCRGVGANLVPSFNDRIRQLATSENVTLVDVHKAFNGDLTLLSSDGLHPNAAGYERIADTFFQSIKGTLEQPTTLAAGSPPAVPFSSN